MIKPNVDSSDEIINGPETYAVIAGELIAFRCCIVGWTDGRSTHHDVLFTLSPRMCGPIYGGLHWGKHLFVTLIRHGAFGFKLGRNEDLFPSYIAEKLNVYEKPTAEALTELINGVMNAMKKITNNEGDKT